MSFKFTNFITFIVFPLLLLFGCTDSVVIPDEKDFRFDDGLYILCEGLWRQDNSTLSHFDFTTNTLLNNVFTQANPLLRLGDTGNDIVYYNGKCYVAVSTSKTIEVFQARTTKSIGRILFEGKIEPRSITILNDSIGYVTTLGDDSVIEFNPTTLQRKKRIPVGPAPEGIANWNNLVFVANSGYGDFRSKEALAGSITVINATTSSVMKSLYVGPNLLSILVDSTTNTLYCYYAHLPSQKDSLGGIVQYSLPDFTEIHRWRVSSARSISLYNQNKFLLFLSEAGVTQLDVTKKDTEPNVIIPNMKKSEIWTGVSYNSDISNPSIIVSNSKNYTVNGSIMMFSPSGVLLKELQVGLNPTKHCYYSLPR
jgi:glutamine cyclotransferase